MVATTYQTTHGNVVNIVSTLLQNIVSFIGLFCKRDYILYISGNTHGNVVNI